MGVPRWRGRWRRWRRAGGWRWQSPKWTKRPWTPIRTRRPGGAVSNHRRERRRSRRLHALAGGRRAGARHGADGGLAQRHSLLRDATPGAATTRCDPLRRATSAIACTACTRRATSPRWPRRHRARRSQSVKFVVDMQAADSVYLLGTRAWALHYTFVRERIDGQPPLDRCDPVQASLSTAAGTTFQPRASTSRSTRGATCWARSTCTPAAACARSSSRSATRSPAPQMRRAFFVVHRRMDAEHVTAWSAARRCEPRQVSRAAARRRPGCRSWRTNAPFRALRFQPLIAGVAFGMLLFFRADELEPAPRSGPDIIVVTDERAQRHPARRGAGHRSVPDAARARATC